MKQKKHKQKRDMCKIRIQQDFIARKKTKTKQGHDKRNLKQFKPKTKNQCLINQR